MTVERIGSATLYLGDCMDILPRLAPALTITDPPYGVTDHDWDEIVPAASWMTAVGCVATATEPYATHLIGTAPLPFRFDMVWVKNCATNAMNAKKMPMRRHERVLVFGRHEWNPQKRRRSAYELARLNREQRETMEYASPDSVLEFDAVNNRSSDRTGHPSQKPVELMRYLIDTFSSGEVCDPFMGSGSTGVAAVQAGRPFIGIEKEPRYFELACRRIEDAQRQVGLFAPASEGA